MVVTSFKTSAITYPFKAKATRPIILHSIVVAVMLINYHIPILKPVGRYELCSYSTCGTRM